MVKIIVKMEANPAQDGSLLNKNDGEIKPNGGLSGKRESISYCDLVPVDIHAEHYGHSKSSMQLSSVSSPNDNLTTTNQLAMPVATTSNSAIPQLKKHNFLATYLHRVFDHCKVTVYSIY